MAAEAARGLSLFNQYGRGGSKRRLELGRLIAEREAISEPLWRQIAGFHARSFGLEDPRSNVEYEDGGADARYIAASILGGEAGREFSMSLIPTLNKD